MIAPQGVACPARVGSLCLLVLLMAKHGADSVHLIRKTSSGLRHSWRKGTCIDAWVVRFGKQCGVAEDHIHVTKHKSGKYGKGPVAEHLGLTHMVDNDMECLWSVMFDPEGNASDTVEQVIQLTGLKPRDIAWPHSARDSLVKLHTWQDVAMHFDLPCHSELWESISIRGPPRRPPMQRRAAEILVATTGLPKPPPPRPHLAVRRQPATPRGWSHPRPGRPFQSGGKGGNTQDGKSPRYSPWLPPGPKAQPAQSPPFSPGTP